MRILLDDQPCPVDAITVGDAINGAAGVAREQGRLIVEVEVDGVLWGRERLVCADDLLSAAGEVRLVSANPEGLVEQALADADRALEAVDDTQQAAAELIESGAPVEAMARLGEALQTWENLRETMLLCAGAVESGSESRDAGITEAVRGLEEKLRLIEAALRAKDPIGLSDVLLYEMPAVVKSWRGALESLRSQVTGEIT